MFSSDRLDRFSVSWEVHSLLSESEEGKGSSLSVSWKADAYFRNAFLVAESKPWPDVGTVSGRPMPRFSYSCRMVERRWRFH